MLDMRRTTPAARRVLLVLLVSLLIGTAPTPARRAEAACGCAASGVPIFKVAKMRGNDLHQVKGSCATPNGTVELMAYQQHLKRERVCPPECPTDTIYSYCIDQCHRTTIATTRADSAGRFEFADIDSGYALQLIATLPSQPNGLDGVYTALRLRSQDPHTGQWSQTLNEPFLQSFNMSWPGYEGGFAYVETRVSGATQMQVTAADGPDDGDQPAIALDVDEDTPNFWLGQHPGGTVEYTRWGICDPSQHCPSDWHVAQSPSITVQSPPLGRGAEYPWALGMVSASSPGGMFIATSIMGPRDIPDVSVQVNVDVDIDLNLGFSFFSLF
jgi:hypothetical protein